MPIKTYLDSGVLMAVANGYEDVSAAAVAIYDDPNREFVYSPFTRLEALPMARRANNARELALYADYFANATEVPYSDALLQIAMGECQAHLIGAMDALHLASAAQASVEEFVTTEKGTKPVNLSRLVKVTSLRS